MLLLEYGGNLYILLFILYVIQVNCLLLRVLMTAVSSRDKQAQETCWYLSKKGIPCLQTPTSCKHGRYFLNTPRRTVTCISVT